MANDSFSKGLTSTLTAPAFVDMWRRRALRVGLVFAILAVVLALLGAKFDQPALGFDHFLRAWLEGFVGCFGLCMGGMALLMVQYLSGGKWGLIVRRPLEAMTRTWPLVVLMWIPVAVLGASYGKLYIYTKYADWAGALKAGKITIEQAHAIHWKQPMLNTPAFYVVSLICFAIFAMYIALLNSWSMKRDADPEPRVAYWRTKFENLSGFGVVLYAALLFILVIYWVMALDPTWYSTIYGFQYLVGQAVLRPGDAEHLLRVCGVSHYLVGQLAGRDSVVPGSHPRRMGCDRDAGCDLPLGDSVQPAVVAGPEEDQEPAVAGVLDHDLRGFL